MSPISTTLVISGLVDYIDSYYFVGLKISSNILIIVDFDAGTFKSSNMLDIIIIVGIQLEHFKKLNHAGNPN